MGVASWLKTRFLGGRSQFHNPYYRFASSEEVRLAATQGIQIDANRAGVDDWLRLPGISIHQARLLVNLRQAGVPFHCLEDIAAALSVSVQQLQPWQPILQFCYYDADSLDAAPTCNPNTDSIEQLCQIPGIDLFLARAIVQNRQQGGKYHHLADLQQRLGLSGQSTADLMHYFRF